MDLHGIINGTEEALCAPPDRILQSVKVKIRIDPPSGEVLIYGGPEYDDPIRATGPEQTVEIETNTCIVIVQKIRGAESYEIETLGFLAQRPLDE